MKLQAILLVCATMTVLINTSAQAQPNASPSNLIEWIILNDRSSLDQALR